MFQGFKKATPYGGARKLRLTLPPVCRVQQGCCFYCQADALRRERERERDSLRTTDGRPQCDQIFLAHNVCHNTQHYLELNTEGGEKVCLPFWQTVNWQFDFRQTVIWQFAIW